MTKVASEARAGVEQPKIDTHNSKPAREHAPKRDRCMGFTATPEQAYSIAVQLHCRDRRLQCLLKQAAALDQNYEL